MIKTVKGFPNYTVSDNGVVYSHNRKRNLTPTICNGYLHVTLYNGDVRKTYKVHRLVAEHFLENPENLSEVNHKDADKTNNDVSNLEWVTHLGNMKHAYNNELVPFMQGERNGQVILTESQVLEIRSKYVPRKYSYYKLGAEYGVSAARIFQIVSNKAWRHI